MPTAIATDAKQKAEDLTLLVTVAVLTSLEYDNVIVDYEVDSTIKYIKIEGCYSQSVIDSTSVKIEMLPNVRSVTAITCGDAVYFAVALASDPDYKEPKTQEERTKMIEFVYNLHPVDYPRRKELNVLNYRRSFLLGLITLSVKVKDTNSLDHSLRYTHIIDLRVFHKSYSFTIQSPKINYHVLEGIDPFRYM